MDAVAVDFTGALVVLGGSRVGLPGKDLGVAERDACVEGVGDRGVAGTLTPGHRRTVRS